MSNEERYIQYAKIILGISVIILSVIFVNELFNKLNEIITLLS
jgi:hypothetical protein